MRMAEDHDLCDLLRCQHGDYDCEERQREAAAERHSFRYDN